MIDIYLHSGLYNKIIWKNLILDSFPSVNIDSYENALHKLIFYNIVKFSTLSLKAEKLSGFTFSCNIFFLIIIWDIMEGG